MQHQAPGRIAIGVGLAACGNNAPLIIARAQEGQLVFRRSVSSLGIQQAHIDSAFGIADDNENAKVSVRHHAELSSRIAGNVTGVIRTAIILSSQKGVAGVDPHILHAAKVAEIFQRGIHRGRCGKHEHFRVDRFAIDPI